MIGIDLRGWVALVTGYLQGTRRNTTLLSAQTGADGIATYRENTHTGKLMSNQVQDMNRQWLSLQHDIPHSIQTDKTAQSVLDLWHHINRYDIQPVGATPMARPLFGKSPAEGSQAISPGCTGQSRNSVIAALFLVFE